MKQIFAVLPEHLNPVSEGEKLLLECKEREERLRGKLQVLELQF